MTQWYLKFVLLSNSGKRKPNQNRMTAVLESAFGNIQQKEKSIISTGNVLSARISFSTPSLFISQLNELLTAHISSVPAASPVTLVCANCRQMRVSLPGEQEGSRAGGRGWEAQGLSRELATLGSYRLDLEVFLSQMLQLFYSYVSLSAHLSGVFKPSQSLRAQ